MSRFFHTLVVAGAAISAAAACGGKSDDSNDDGTSSGGSGASGGASLAGNGGATPGGATSTTGGTGLTPGTGGASVGGMAGGIAVGGGGIGGAPVMLPEPGNAAQWNCEGVVTGECSNFFETTATYLPGPCPVDPDRPQSPADCARGELFTCYLALTQAGEPLLVNCECQIADEYSCSSCTGILTYTYGEPIVCDTTHKVCACAYTGILK